MYHCNECGREFETPGVYVNEEYYGYKEEMECCPHCSNREYDELKRCSRCGEIVPESELTEGICPVCEKEIQEKVNSFFRQFNEAEINYIFESGILEGI